MAFSTCKGLVMASAPTEADGEVTYESGWARPDYLCRVQIAYQRSDLKEYADGIEIDHDKGITGMTVTFEMADTPTKWRELALGEYHSMDGALGDVWSLRGGTTPTIGVGFILARRYKGGKTYDAYWIPKAKFAETGLTSNTKRDEAQWEHETYEGTVLPVTQSDGSSVYRILHEFDTEADAEEWLQEVLGVT